MMLEGLQHSPVPLRYSKITGCQASVASSASPPSQR
jgi:hypothetical protein